MKARNVYRPAGLLLAAFAVAALAAAGLGRAWSGKEGSRPLATCHTAPCYRLTVIGKLPSSAASLPQSIDAQGDVAGLSGQVAATSPALEGRYAFDEGTGYVARIFLYRRGRLRFVRPPRTRRGPLFPANVVLAAPHLLAATFQDASGMAYPFYGRVQTTSVAWHRLRLTAGEASDATAGSTILLALPGRRLVGTVNDVAYAVVWSPSASGYGSARIPPGGPDTFGQAPRGVDRGLDEVGNECCLGTIVYPRGSSRPYGPSSEGLPRPGPAAQSLGFYGYDISQASGPPTAMVRVAAVYQVHAHVTDEALWRLRMRGGRVRHVVWASRPTLVRGVPPYRDLVVPPPRFRGDYTNVPSNGGGLTSSGGLSGSMGWYRKDRPPEAWCVLTPSGDSRRVKTLVPDCWTTHDLLHGYVYTNGRTYDLNKRVVNRGNWAVEAATSGVPGSEIFSYGPSMNARGDIIAVGYRSGPNRRLLRACRRSAVWHSKRHLCALSAKRGPETALLLTPFRRSGE